MRLIDADALMEAINTWPKFGVDERCRIVPWSERYEPYIHLRDVVIAITGMPTIEECKTGNLISRQAAIDAVNEYLRLSEVSKTVQNMTSIQGVLRRLPSAQPYRR